MKKQLHCLIYAFYRTIEQLIFEFVFSRMFFSFVILFVALHVTTVEKNGSIKNWERSFKCELNILKISGGKVKKFKCVVCSKYEERIKNMKGFSRGWVDGTESIKKGQLGKAYQREPHKKARDLQLRNSLGGEAYRDQVVVQSDIGKGLAKMLDSDREVRPQLI